MNFWKLLFACGLLLMQITPTAHAYQRTKTALGVPVAWTQMPIPYAIGAKGSKDVDDGSDIDAIKKAFATWLAVDCASFEVSFVGLVDQPKAEYIPGGPNQHHIYWVEPPEPWPFATGAVAVTTLQFDAVTGQIQDADIRFNGHTYQWSTAETPPEGKQDILNTATHEVGHFLGLEHTDNSLREATMFGDTSSGETLKRDLLQDDRDGICAIYPATKEKMSFRQVSSDPGATPCPTRSSLSTSGSASGAAGCQQAGPPASFLLPGLLLLFIALRRRKRRV